MHDMLKTLNIKSNGTFEFTYGNDSYCTDVTDELIPSWAMTQIQHLYDGMGSAGCDEIHYEDTGRRQMHHRMYAHEVRDDSSPAPDVFDNLETLASEYKAALHEEAVADGEAQRLAALSSPAPADSNP